MKKNFLITALSVVFISVMLASCMMTTDDGYTCIKTPTGCGMVYSCSDVTSSYYDLDGTKYWCDGTDCDAAADEVVDAMCGKSATTEPKEITKEKLIDASYDVLENKSR